MDSTTIDLTYPSYDVESQLTFLGSLCETVNFDCKKLIPLIFADWIYTFQKGCQVAPPIEVFVNYIKSTKSTYTGLKDLKEMLHNETDK